MFDPESAFLEEPRPLGHVEEGLAPVTSTGDGRRIDSHSHVFLDTVPSSDSLAGQLALAMSMDGAWEVEEQRGLFRRLLEGLSSDETETGSSQEMERSEPQAPEIPLRGRCNSSKMRTLKKIDKRNKPSANTQLALAMDMEKEETPSESKSEESLLTVPSYQKKEKRRVARDSSHDSFGQTNVNRLILYNWYMLRMDNTKIMGGLSQDFNLLRLLAGTHEARRWWTILIDDLACPQCVATLRAKRADAQLIISQVAWKGHVAKCSRHVHCDGGRCRVACAHTSRESNQVTRFFSKLGLESARRMRNISLETHVEQIPDADVLVSAVHNAGYYFTDVQNIEILFHFGDTALDRDTWTRILCCCRQLEGYLPKGQHLRVKGIDKHTELQNGWTRKGRKWHE